MMKKILLVMVLYGASWCGDGGNYFTYCNLTVWIERQNELGEMDTIKIENVVAKTIYPSSILLKVAGGKRINVVEPNQKIIKEAGE